MMLAAGLKSLVSMILRCLLIRKNRIGLRRHTWGNVQGYFTSTGQWKSWQTKIRRPGKVKVEGGCHDVTPPREDAQDHVIFISLTGVLYAVVNSQKDKGKALKNTSLKTSYHVGFIKKLKRFRKSINKPLKKKKMQQLHCSMMT